MKTILANVEEFLDSDNINAAREEIAKNLNNLESVDTTVRGFAALLALGSQKALEIGLGVLGRKLLEEEEPEDNVIWLLLAAVLSRNSIPTDSPSRISILGLTSSVKSWESPIFSLLTPVLDSFLRVSLAEGNTVIAEQTLDFLAISGENYAKAPHTKQQLKELDSLTQLVLNKVDDAELKEEWAEGINLFLKTAVQTKYSDENVWSAAKVLLKEIYTPQVLNRKTNSEVKDNLSRLITSSLAALGTIIHGDGLSVAVRIDSIDNPKDNNSWAIFASVTDKLERLFQEIAALIFRKPLPPFSPPQAIPGSWTIIFHISLSSKQSNDLAMAISSLSSISDNEHESKSSQVDSWRACFAEFKKDELRVDLAVSTHAPELNVTQSISTEDIDITNMEEYLQEKTRVLSRDVPQADKLERILDFASLLIQYPSSLPTFQQEFLKISDITERQYQYYRRAVEILGLVDERGRPTNACSVLNRLSSREAKMRFLAHQFISSDIGLAWLNWQNASDLSEIEIEKANQFLTEVSPSLSASTINRRVRTLRSWLGEFIQYL